VGSILPESERGFTRDVDSILDSTWTPVTSPTIWKHTNQFRVSLFCWGLVLVDLVRFELTTSSMPFKKYQ